MNQFTFAILHVTATLAALLVPTAVSAGSPSDTSSLSGSKPNIVFVLTDDQGMGDMSCMGNKVLKTPNIDQLFQQ